jgi:ubiquinone/menaquinone biosynthesis C-methylase UbiE
VLGLPTPERLLLIGGTGIDAAPFLAREFPAARVRATDPSAERARAAQAKLGLDPEGRIAFKQAGPRSLPYPEGFFDLAAQLEGRVSAGELARVLRPGGSLVLAPLRAPRYAARPRGRLLHAALARHGFVVLRAERAGGGNFTVARLGEPG